MNSNQFKIKDHAVLNDVVNTISLNGSIQLFTDKFTISYNLSKQVQASTEAPMPLPAANNTVSGSVVIMRDSLETLDEDSILNEVLAQLGLELA